jgi:hypothetical protein
VRVLIICISLTTGTPRCIEGAPPLPVASFDDAVPLRPDLPVAVAEGDPSFERAVLLRYGFAHIRAHAAPSAYLSLRRVFLGNSFRSFQHAVMPKALVSARLLSQLETGNETTDASARLLAQCSGTACNFEEDLGALATLPGDTKANQDKSSVFFRIRHSNPAPIKGQASSSSIDWTTGEVIVTEVSPILIDRDRKDCFLWTEPASMAKDLQIVSPSAQLVEHLTEWQSVP